MELPEEMGCYVSLSLSLSLSLFLCVCVQGVNCLVYSLVGDTWTHIHSTFFKCNGIFFFAGLRVIGIICRTGVAGE